MERQFRSDSIAGAERKFQSRRIGQTSLGAPQIIPPPGAAVMSWLENDEISTVIFTPRTDCNQLIAQSWDGVLSRRGLPSSEESDALTTRPVNPSQDSCGAMERPLLSAEGGAACSTGCHEPRRLVLTSHAISTADHLIARVHDRQEVWAAAMDCARLRRQVSTAKGL